MDRRMKVRRGLAFLAAGLLFFHTPLGASAGETDPEARPQTAASPRAADNDASAGLDFQWTQYVPATETTYTAGGGQIVWTPKVSGGGGELFLWVEAWISATDMCTYRQPVNGRS